MFQRVRQISFRFWIPIGIFVLLCLYLLATNTRDIPHDTLEENSEEYNNQVPYDVSYVKSEKRVKNNDTDLSDDTLDKLKHLLNCDNKQYPARTYQRGPYWVLENYVRASHGNINCYESITYTTHGDYTFLDNVIPLVKRWKAPIGMSLFSPGTDFKTTVEAIRFLRECTGQEDADLVKKYVTFHIYFHADHIPISVPSSQSVFKNPYQCPDIPPYESVNHDDMFKTLKKLTYPINVGRNIARDAAITHFIYPSDIELYPSLHVVPKFLDMIARNEGPLLNKKPRVFPLPVFEVKENVKVPDNKTELMKMLKTKDAILFHKNICATCHAVPEMTRWEKTPEGKKMSVFTVGKRQGSFQHWEPIFIGTNREPYYEERLTWEGKRDKMTQGYQLCVRDYEFHVLSDAFLVHRPGIKVMAAARRVNHESVTNNLISKKISRELHILFGQRDGCVI